MAVFYYGAIISIIELVSYPPSFVSFGAYAILPYPIVCCIVTILLLKFMPETRGRTVHGITCAITFMLQVDEIVSRWQRSEAKTLEMRSSSASLTSVTMNKNEVVRVKQCSDQSLATEL